MTYIVYKVSVLKKLIYSEDKIIKKYLKYINFNDFNKNHDMYAMDLKIIIENLKHFNHPHNEILLLLNRLYYIHLESVFE